MPFPLLTRFNAPPPAVVATWPTPNYLHPVTRGPTLLIVESTLIALTTVIVALRLYIRHTHLRALSYDDHLILAALLPTIGLTVVVCLAATRYDWDVHIWDLAPAHFANTRKVALGGQAMYILSSVLTKLSILASVLRIAPAGSSVRKAVYLAMVLTGLYIPVFLIVLFAQCRPLSKYWHPSMEGYCIPEGPVLITSCVYSLLCDVVVYLLPLPLLVNLKLPRRQKAALIGVFALGALVVVAGVMRLYWVYVVVDVSYDLTWEGFNTWMWTAVEVDVGVVVACLPTLRPVVGRFLDQRRRGRTRMAEGYVDESVEMESRKRGSKALATTDVVPLRAVTEYSVKEVESTSSGIGGEGERNGYAARAWA